jgi:hypothetical protein
VRVLVTGSRAWTDPDLVRERLRECVVPGQALTVVHGGAGGVDATAANWCAEHIARGWAVAAECHRADWSKHGMRAGIIRNIEMVKAGADLCLAFIRDESKGASHCARIAQQAGIETRIYRWEDRVVSP